MNRANGASRLLAARTSIGGIEARMAGAKRGQSALMSADEFWRKYGAIVPLDELKGPTSMADLYKAGPRTDDSAQILALLRQWRPIRLLVAAAKANSPDAFRVLLSYILLRVKADPPDGVIVPAPGRPGRRPSPETERTFLRWIEIGRPSLKGEGVKRLSRAMYGSAAYTKAKAHERKRIDDRVRERVERHLKQLATQTGVD